MRGANVLAGVVVACALVVAAHAQQASFLPPSASGGGTTEGAAISGGTASRLLFSDGSTQVSTASPALGAALTLSGALTAQSTLDIRGNISNGGSGTCFTGNTGFPCFTEGLSVFASGTNSNVSIAAGGTAATGAIAFFDSSGVSVGDLRYFGSTRAETEMRNKIVLNGTSSIITGVRSAVAAGTNIHEFRDGASMENLLASVDGAGNLFLNASATRSKGTITLAAGTGTVTVASGSVCTCSDTTAANAVRCAVAATTLTATGTGTDVISYICL